MMSAPDMGTIGPEPWGSVASLPALVTASPTGARAVSSPWPGSDAVADPWEGRVVPEAAISSAFAPQRRKIPSGM